MARLNRRNFHATYRSLHRFYNQRDKKEMDGCIDVTQPSVSHIYNFWVRFTYSFIASTQVQDFPVTSQSQS